MNLFEEKDFGQPISEELSNYLRQYTGNKDRANVSRKTGMGVSTIRDVAFRTNSLTKINSNAITELAKEAVMNSVGSIESAAKIQEEIIKKLAIKLEIS